MLKITNILLKLLIVYLISLFHLDYVGNDFNFIVQSCNRVAEATKIDERITCLIENRYGVVDFGWDTFKVIFLEHINKSWLEVNGVSFYYIIEINWKIDNLFSV